METKHTKGPWTAARHSGYHAITNEMNGSTHTVVPMVYGDGDDEAEANAWLIAAAPELLDALKEMTETGGWMPSDERFVRANAAIAKATGTK